MRILVIDDSQKHLDSAIRTLKGHEVTLCSSHDEAMDLLWPEYDEKKKDELEEFYRNLGKKDPLGRAMMESAIPKYDVVLCDLLMPAGSYEQGKKGMKFIGQEMAIGWSLALFAAKYGVKHVAVVTDTNHHHHPASAMLDSIEGFPMPIFNGSKILFENDPWLLGDDGDEYVKEGAKDWGKVLVKLLEDE